MLFLLSLVDHISISMWNRYKPGFSNMENRHVVMSVTHKYSPFRGPRGSLLFIHLFEYFIQGRI